MPVTDDSPFFYQYNKWNTSLNDRFQNSYFDKIRGLWHLFVLSSLLLSATVLSLLFVVLPLIITRKGVGNRRLSSFTFIYFLSIGFAFMLMEMSVIQQFALFLGHPIYSMALVIPVILVCAGLGSLFSQKLRSRGVEPPLYSATAICAVLILGVRVCIPAITGFFLQQSLPVRIATTIMTIALPSFCMGFPFPLAIQKIASCNEKAIPWAWAINGSGSVIASILAVMIAMQYGFKMVLLVSALCYLCACAASLLLIKAKA